MWWVITELCESSSLSSSVVFSWWPLTLNVDYLRYSCHHNAIIACQVQTLFGSTRIKSSFDIIDYDLNQLGLEDQKDAHSSLAFTLKFTFFITLQGNSQWQKKWSKQWLRIQLCCQLLINCLSTVTS